MIKRIVLLGAMLAMMAFLAAPALAAPPEDRPPVDPGVETGADRAQSFCAFSGLNDFDPEEEPPFDTKTQNYGQLVQQGFKGVFPSPGDACNPTKPPPEEPA